MRFLLLIILTYGGAAHAFPDLALQNGYGGSCASCHWQVAGAGPLTPYGRSMASELLSTWNAEGEENVGHIKYEMPKGLIVGGDMRAVYFGGEETPERFLPMQKAVSLGFNYEVLTIIGEIGLYNDRDIESRNRYFIVNPTDFISFRSGKYLASYGIKWADHTVFSRGPLGLGEGQESYNNEVAISTKYGELFLTAIDRTKSETGKYTLDPGYVARLSVFPTKNSIMGASWWRQENNQEVKCGGFFEFFYYGFFGATDVNEVWNRSGNVGNLFAYSRISRSLYRGISLLYENNYSKIDFVSSRKNGLALNWFPRPHWELYGSLQQQDGKNGFVLMGHYYL